MISYVSVAQQNDALITVAFDNISIEDAILVLEDKSPYRFYYQNDWLKEIRVTGNFQNTSITQICEIIFQDTPLNFYVTKDLKVMLTQYNQIYNTLPNGFFQSKNEIEKKDEEIVEAPKAVFYKESKFVQSNKLKTVRIGKQRKDNVANEYQLSGIIMNATNNTPAANVSVIVDGGKKGAVSNSDGSFSLRLLAGVHILKTKSLSFQEVEQRVVLFDNGAFSIKLQEKFEGLDEVLLEGNANIAVKEVTGGVTKVDVEDSKNIPLVLGERDIFKVAATMPGISSAGEGANGYNVRGGKTDQNLILLDDGVVYNPAHFFGIFSAINPFSTSEVSIYKGHVPANYGGRLSSVFDIKSKDAIVNNFSGEASLGLVTSNILLEVPVIEDKAGVLIGGRATYSDYILRNLEEEELKKSTASFYDGILKYNHTFSEKDKIKATGYYSKDKFNVTTDSLIGYSNRMASLRWDHTFNDRNDGALIITNSQYQFNLDFEGQTNLNFESGYTINETEIKLDLSNRSFENHRFIYGLATKFYGVEPGFKNPLGDNSQIIPVTIADEQANESALYISDNYKITEKLSVEAGLRFSFFTFLGPSNQNIYQDGFPKNGSSLIESKSFESGEAIESYAYPEVRLSSRYLLFPDFSVKASFNNAVQYIHRLSTNTTASPVDTWKLSDINIKPQRGNQYSLGFFKNFDSNIYELSIEGYYKKSQDILDYKTGATLLFNENLEQEVLQGEGKSYGVEFLIKKTKGKFNGWLGYTYSRSLMKFESEFPQERINNGDYFPSNYDKPHDFSFVGNYKLTRRVSFSSNFVYQTGRPVTVPVGNYVIDNTELVVFSDRNEFRIPDYYRLDIGVNVEGNHKLKKLAHSFWTFSIYNVLGRNNPYSVFFVADDGDIKAYQTSIFTIPVPTISYNLKF
ncbi:TonB-dependent receptor [Patiriisocius marinistellae]|uniref:TonB-dependent receptor n=2 Tax=Patiriisocius marinistellae TaxID=2494560 RepID=A0A5J4FX24_9FLAO|nr:TonB-dependent receptor [Patiriisocius marinistellae]